MSEKTFLKGLILCSIYLSFVDISFAKNIDLSATKSDSKSIKIINTSSISNQNSEIKINLVQQQNSSLQQINLSDDNSLINITNATDKFVQRNINASREDFKSIINNIDNNDFFYLIMANKMAELGFYDLSNLAFSKAKDNEFINISKNSIKKYYFPIKSINTQDELFLAQIYSDISFNNRSKEATSELLKNNKLCEFDYANYLLALGLYKSDYYDKALTYINKAIKLNPNNLNYLFLKAKIYADNKNFDNAVKTVKNIKKSNIQAFLYQNKIAALESYIIYKTKKFKGQKYYNLGKYYYIENDYSKAIKSLQIASSDKNKSSQAKIYGLMSEIYFKMQEYQKAEEAANKACKINSFQYEAILTLADLNFKNKNYKKALSFYKKAIGKDDNTQKAKIKTAKTYEKLDKKNKSKEIYAKIIKQNPNNWEAYYELSLLDRIQAKQLLKKSIAINPQFANSWAELAKYKIEEKDFVQAEKYLINAHYIDENNFKYYYYQGLLCKNTGNLIEAKQNFKKCLDINPNNPGAQRELGNIEKVEDSQGSL